MTQVISLFFIPPEILAQILDFVDECTIMLVARLILVNKNARTSISYTIPHIRMLNTMRDEILDMFIGVRHLDIQNETFNLGTFNSRIWKNLESLTISTRICQQLYKSEYLRSLLTDDKTDNLLTYFMPNLRCLEIYDQRFYEFVQINLKVFPSLKILKIINGNIENLNQFTSLERLEIYNPNVYESQRDRINNLNLRTLLISESVDIVRHLHLDSLNISSLECLILRNLNISLDDLKNLNINKLVLENVQVEVLYKDLIMKHLKSLVLKKSRFGRLISHKLFPALTYLRMVGCKNIFAIPIGTSGKFEVIMEDCSTCLVVSTMSRYDQSCLRMQRIISARDSNHQTRLDN